MLADFFLSSDTHFSHLIYHWSSIPNWLFEIQVLIKVIVLRWPQLFYCFHALKLEKLLSELRAFFHFKTSMVDLKTVLLLECIIRFNLQVNVVMITLEKGKGTMWASKAQVSGGAFLPTWGQFWPLFKIGVVSGSILLQNVTLPLPSEIPKNRDSPQPLQEENNKKQWTFRKCD